MSRTLESDGKRIKIQRIYVSALVKKKLDAWRAHYGIPYGRIVDAMFRHCEQDVHFTLPLRGFRPSLKGEIVIRKEPLVSE